MGLLHLILIVLVNQQQLHATPTCSSLFLCCPSAVRESGTFLEKGQKVWCVPTCFHVIVTLDRGTLQEKRVGSMDAECKPPMNIYTASVQTKQRWLQWLLVPETGHFLKLNKEVRHGGGCLHTASEYGPVSGGVGTLKLTLGIWYAWYPWFGMHGECSVP